MTKISSLKNIHVKGFFGDYENKDEKNLLKISESKDLLIVQIVQYKNSLISTERFKVDNLILNNETLNVTSNAQTRILWNGPNNWLLVSSKKEILKETTEKFDENNFAITELSDSRTIIGIEGKMAKEVLKKGCPYNFNDLKKKQLFKFNF